jgi:MFS family permease
VVASDSFISKFLATDASTKSGTVVALFTGGAFFGAGAAGFLDRWSRRYCITLGAGIYLVGGVLQTAAENVEMLYIGRFIAGFGVGILVEIVPMFQSEIAHASIRGIITSLVQTMLGIGALVANWIGYGCFTRWTGTGNDAQWRIPYARTSRSSENMLTTLEDSVFSFCQPSALSHASSSFQNHLAGL